MATQVDIDYALMAGHAYRTTRDEINWIPAPAGWTPFFPVPDDSTAVIFPVGNTGFEAISFKRGSEIVISFSGTDPNNSDLLTSPDGRTNSALANGKWSDQLLQAAKYYLDVKIANPNAVITLTGHSLGGGLAALVAVFFDVYAQTFDQAPFSKSALNVENNNAQDLRDHLAALGTPYSTSLDKLDTYIQLRDASTTNGYIPRQERIDTIRVAGEFLDGGLVGNQSFGNPQTTIPHGPADWIGASFDLHSQALLTAFLQSEKTALSTSTPDHTLSEVSKKLTPLLEMLFSKALYAYDAGDKETPKENFLDRIVRHETGVQGTFAADAMVTRFTKDLWKLAQDGGLTMLDGNPNGPSLNDVSKTLIAFAMQMYYEDTANATNSNKTLFSDVTGGVRFDITDVIKNSAVISAAGDALDLSQAKGFDLYFKSYLQQSTFTAAERQLIQSVLPYMRDWYVQAGAGAMVATDTLNQGAFMLGGTGGDTLSGGSGADLLVGNAGEDTLHGNAGADVLVAGAGADTLTGGAGNDMLLGGAGQDTYQFSADFGLDVVQDSDGQGSLQIAGTALTGGKRIATDVWESADRKYRYAVVDGQLVASINSAESVGLNGSVIKGLGGNDALSGSIGKDDIFGDDGDDLIGGGAGSDNIRGGDGNDFICSSSTLWTPQRSKPTDNWSPGAGKFQTSKTSMSKTACARSMRLAGHKWLGRRMDSVRGGSGIQFDIQKRKVSQ